MKSGRSAPRPFLFVSRVFWHPVRHSRSSIKKRPPSDGRPPWLGALAPRVGRTTGRAALGGPSEPANAQQTLASTTPERPKYRREARIPIVHNRQLQSMHPQQAISGTFAGPTTSATTHRQGGNSCVFCLSALSQANDYLPRVSAKDLFVIMFFLSCVSAKKMVFFPSFGFFFSCWGVFLCFGGGVFFLLFSR